MCQIRNAKSFEGCSCSYTYFCRDSSSLERCPWAMAKQMDCPDFQWETVSVSTVPGPCPTCRESAAKGKRGGVLSSLLKLSGPRK